MPDPKTAKLSEKSKMLSDEQREELARWIFPHRLSCLNSAEAYYERSARPSEEFERRLRRMQLELEQEPEYQHTRKRLELNRQIERLIELSRQIEKLIELNRQSEKLMHRG